MYRNARATGASVQEPETGGACGVADGSVAATVADSGAVTASAVTASAVTAPAVTAPAVTSALPRSTRPAAQEANEAQRSGE